MIRDYDSIIEFENENSGVDFKAVQYAKNKHFELLKDIVSMANAEVEGERLIIIGVKHKPNGEREIRPINGEDFVDSATYQQLVRENIEPELEIEYEPYYFKEKLLGLIKINNCFDPPYMLKKDFSNLSKGDCYIRKGSHQLKALRSDLDKLYKKKNDTPKFDECVFIGFTGANLSNEITLNPIENVNLPSKIAAEKIRSILVEKKSQIVNSNNYHSLLSKQLREAARRPMFGSVPYENRSIETLEADLADVEETYREDDIFEILEIQSFRLNFDILNSGSEYIQDATVLIELKADESFKIPDRILEEPSDNSFLSKLPPLHNIISSYPNVEQIDETIRITSKVGEVKHHLPSLLLAEDLRLAIFKKPESGSIPISIKLFAKNLRNPIKRTLNIRVEDN